MNRPNTLSKSFINHTAILDMIDIVICHGGNGTIYQALSHGIPVICITNNFEQEWNSQRIEELELGTLINDISDVKEIRRVIDFWINRKRSNHFIMIQQKVGHQGIASVQDQHTQPHLDGCLFIRSCITFAGHLFPRASSALELLARTASASHPS